MTIDDVVAAIAAKVVVTTAAQQCIVAIRTVERIVSAAAIQVVSINPAAKCRANREQPVMARTPQQRIVTAAATDNIVTTSTIEQIAAGVTS